MLAKYKQYLQSCYNARVLVPADKYLPTLESPYINLAMIRRGRYDYEQRHEFIKRKIHGRVDQILESKAPINIEDLLTSEGSGRPVRFILVEGPPGIGKSTFAWEVCRRWDKIESLRDYHTVVLLKLREKWVFNATSLPDLFRYEYDPDMSKSISLELAKTEGSNLLLVLDGFDEASDSFTENSVIKYILCRQLLPECTIILTTRPVAKATLESILQPQVDKNVEIIGFTEEERVRYITEVFSNEPELQAHFLKYMFLVPYIKSMMYIPLNCAIIAQVYYESHLTIPKTTTQLYKALIHSLLVRHMKMEGKNFQYASMLPEGLCYGWFEKFKNLAKFAFSSYHKSDSMKVNFIKQDFPQDFFHFGFMNEMYFGHGVERTFSFLHISLHEYLAAWHLAHSNSIEFQMVYHQLSMTKADAYLQERVRVPVVYKGDNRSEEALISFLKTLRKSLVEPAIFLAGITGWRCQSEDDRNHWEMYLSHDTAHITNLSVLVQSLYESQNPILLQHFFAAEGNSDVRTKVTIDSGLTPYDCYALSYCLAHSSNHFKLYFHIRNDADIVLVETFVKGLDDHCRSITPTVTQLKVEFGVELHSLNRCLFWLMKARCWMKLEEIILQSSCDINSDIFYRYLHHFPQIQLLKIHIPFITSWRWLTALKCLSGLKVLHIYNNIETAIDPGFETEAGGTEVLLDIDSSKMSIPEVGNTALDLVQKSILRSNTFTKVTMSKISHEDMAYVHSILLHSPSLTTFALKRTRLGYDGILYICSALRNNTTLRRLVIHDDLQLPPRRESIRKYNYVTFLNVERVPLPGKTTCTDFLLELNNILKDNTTLEEMKIQSGLFLPLSAGEDGEYCQWTGLGPLQQFNVGAVGSGMSPNLRRSFSSSDLTQPQTTLFWDRQFTLYMEEENNISFKELFSKRKEEGKKLFSLPSFTAPDTEVLQSFSGLDPRLKECLEISHLHQYGKRLRDTGKSSFMHFIIKSGIGAGGHVVLCPRPSLPLYFSVEYVAIKPCAHIQYELY